MTITAESINPWYVDWKFWSMVLSFIAIALSQLPPIKLWFRRNRIDVEVPSRIIVNHWVGNPNIGAAIVLRNNGWRTLQVRSIELDLFRDGKDLQTFRAQDYFESVTSDITTLMIPFSLKPDDSWVHGTNFYNSLNRKNEQIYRSAFSTLQEVIQEKIGLKAPDDKRLVEAGPELVEPFMKLFEELFIWESGEYVINFRVVTAPTSAIFNRKYRFTLYESDTAELRKYVEECKFGCRIIWPKPNSPLGVKIPLADSGRM